MPDTGPELTLDDVRARMRAAGIHIDEARLPMVRGLLASALGPIRAADWRGLATLEPAVTFDAEWPREDRRDG